jgi:hypothetical protein
MRGLIEIGILNIGRFCRDFGSQSVAGRERKVIAQATARVTGRFDSHVRFGTMVSMSETLNLRWGRDVRQAPAMLTRPRATKRSLRAMKLTLRKGDW